MWGTNKTLTGSQAAARSSEKGRRLLKFPKKDKVKEQGRRIEEKEKVLGKSNGIPRGRTGMKGRGARAREEEGGRMVHGGFRSHTADWGQTYGGRGVGVVTGGVNEPVGLNAVAGRILRRRWSVSRSTVRLFCTVVIINMPGG